MVMTVVWISLFGMVNIPTWVTDRLKDIGSDGGYRNIDITITTFDIHITTAMFDKRITTATFDIHLATTTFDITIATATFDINSTTDASDRNVTTLTTAMTSDAIVMIAACDSNFAITMATITFTTTSATMTIETDLTMEQKDSNFRTKLQLLTQFRCSVNTFGTNITYYIIQTAIRKPHSKHTFV